MLGNARGAFWTVDILQNGGYEGPRHFDFKPPRTEDMDGVWASAAGWRAQLPHPAREGHAFWCRPRGRRGAGRCLGRRAKPAYVGAGESLADLRGRGGPGAGGGGRGMAFEHLDQLALEHLYGVRG